MKLRLSLRFKQKLKLRSIIISGAILAVLSTVIIFTLSSPKTTLAGNGTSVNTNRSSNSVLVNFGGASCGSSLSQSDVSLFGNAQTASPVSLLSFNTNAIGNVFSKFIAYNPVNNKIYINDISDGVNSKIYILDIGIPASLSTPSISSPSYTIPNQVLNQFEFDQLGDLYAIDSYYKNNATANIAAYDDTTGIQLSGSLKSLIFPVANRPGDLNSGDIAITPNGRLFAVFGSDTSKIYEITNYKRNSVGNATATFLGLATKACYGIAFDNGYIIIAGSDFGGGCYSYKYDINDNVLHSETASSNNSLPIDMSSFSPSIGCAKKVISATKVDNITYDLVYQIFIQNKGNVKIGNVQITDDLDAVFGAGNIVSVSTSWVSNGALLTLNTSYNGGSDKNLLTSGLLLLNTPAARTSSTLRLSVRVTNLRSSATYLNVAIAIGSIGSGSNILNLKDTSNDYTSAYASWSAATDPDNNTVSDDTLENTPTPWSFIYSSALPIELISFNAKWNQENVRVYWTTATESSNDYFIVERSFDLLSFEKLTKVQGNGTTSVPHNYLYDDDHVNHHTDVYYRLKQVDYNGTTTYYDPIHLNKKQKQNGPQMKLYPNPASGYVTIDFTDDISLENLQLKVFDLASKTIGEYPIIRLPFVLPTAAYKQGIYFIEVGNGEKEIGSKKFFVK